MNKVTYLSIRYIKARKEDRLEIFMINIIMTKEIIKIDIDHTIQIEEFHLIVGYNVDAIA